MTYQHTEKNNLWTLITYPPTASLRSFGPVRAYIQQLWHNKHRQVWYCFFQYAALVACTAIALWLDWKKAILYLIIPQQVSMYSVMLFNYLQHVDADEESEYNHSRNFIGACLNIFLFNNGYHMVHHRTPGLHWSRLKEAHNRIAHHIHPTLLERNIIWMIFRTYILSLFIPRYRPISLRLERIDKGATWV
jgi:hypothetical protein